MTTKCESLLLTCAHCLMRCAQQYEIVFADDVQQTKLHFVNRDGDATGQRRVQPSPACPNVSRSQPLTYPSLPSLPSFRSLLSAKYLNGDSYTGGYQSGKRHGQGRYIFANGSSYSGGWERGLKHGQGSISYPDKATYTGGWSLGKRDGSGLYVYPSGDTFDGEWKAGVKSGCGVYTFAKSKEQVRGEWSNGALMSGRWQQARVTVIGNFRNGQPHGHTVVVTPSKAAVAGRYSTSNTFLPMTLPSTPAPSTSSPLVLTIPSTLTVAARQLENAVLSLDHLEGLSRLRSPLPASVPNFHRVGATPFYLCAQPTVSGLQAAVAHITGEGFESVLYLNARAEAVVYVGDRGFVPRHPKRVTRVVELALSKDEGEQTEDAFAARIDERIQHRGRVLSYVKETYAELREDRRHIAMEEEVAGAARSTKAAVAALVEEEGLAVRYERVRMGEGRVGWEDVQAVWEALSGVEEGTAVLVSDWMGRENATLVGVLGVLMGKIKAGEGDEPTKEEETAEDKDDQQQPADAEASNGGDEGDKVEKDDEEEDEDEKEEEKEEEAEDKEEKTADPATETTTEVDPASQAETKPETHSETSGETTTETAVPTEQPPSTDEAVPVSAVAAAEIPAEASIPTEAAAPAPVEAAPVPLTNEERAALLKAGQYALVTRLLAAVGPFAVKAKTLVDASADSASAMIHLRECVCYAWEQWRDGQRREWVDKGRTYAQRYAVAIVAAAWALEGRQQPAQPEPAADAEEEATPVPTITLAQWLQARPAISALIAEELSTFLFNC